MPKNRPSEPANYDSMKCIWMSSNTVEYKLCDKNFDCDNCVFDKIMRNITPGSSQPGIAAGDDSGKNIIQRKIDLLKSINYSPAYYYLKNSILLKKLFDKTYYLGLDKSVYLFLDNLKEYEFMSTGSGIKKGNTILKLWGEWGEAHVLSPVSFLIVDKLKHNIDDFRVNSWLSMVDVDPEEIEQCRMDEDEYMKKIDGLGLKLKEFENEYSFLGARMNDGGVNVKFLYQVTGIKKYKKFLDSLFANEG